MPKTVTCRVLSSDMLKALLNSKDDVEPSLIQQGLLGIDERCHNESSSTNDSCSLLLTGLHACGDLSVTMLRTFLESEQVKAVVSIGCCYNLLSEDEDEDGAVCGFPISRGVKSTGLRLTRNSRDLACQSADRWRALDKDGGVHNFELHAFRAAFQMVLSRYFPETLSTSPRIGRQGKALRRQQQRQREMSCRHCELESSSCPAVLPVESMGSNGKERCSLFEKFSKSGMHRLNVKEKENVDFSGIWKEAEPFTEVIGAYWSLRAAMGPVLETLILLDRLLLLQEEEERVEGVMLVKVKVMMSNNEEDKKKVAISMVEASLPPGFRFHPRDEELISDYLSNKVYSASATDDDDHLPLLPQVDLNHCEPWDLPEMACVGGKEWYFYSQRDRKYATGLRTNRATVSGYWKATGKDRCILGKQIVVGMRKTLVFYLGRAPKGKKTDWVMHEFRLQPNHHHHSSSSSSLKDQDWVLCRVFCKNRELVGGKQINHEDTQSCSSVSLPPLMDPSYYTFSPVPTTNMNDIFNHEQVPCLSTNNPIGSIPITIPIPIPSSSISSISQSLDHYSSCCGNSNSNSKKEVFKAILSRFNEQLDHECSATNLSFAQGISDQSFLSDAALPVTMWYP